jgi:small-conductance mechanosensitive channel
MILNTTVKFGYSVPWRAIHETLIKAAQATNGVVAEPPPFVLQTSLNDFCVSYEINAYTDQPNKAKIIYSELHQNIQDLCNQADIDMTAKN